MSAPVLVARHDSGDTASAPAHDEGARDICRNQWLVGECNDDRVDVIMTPRNRDADKGGGNSETILRNIRVLAIDQNVEEKNGQKVVVGKTAMLELTPGQAETLALSHQVGLLSLALRSIADGTQDNTDDSARQSVNVVRFGVSTTATPR